MEEKFGQAGLRVIAVHAPEFDFEKRREQVESVAKRHQKTHPIFMDNELSYWSRLGNRYWPAFYLVDRKANIRYRYEGEMHLATDRGDQAARFLQELLAESP
jgi:hypothetical protein